MLFRYTGYFLWRRIPAGRAVQPVVVPDIGPWGKSDADRRLGIMDPAIDFPVMPPLEERARGTLFPARINPVIDPVNAGQVFLYNARSSAVSPVRKVDKDMREDVITASCNPWHEVIDDPVLVPSPFLAAFPALPAILSHGTVLSGEL